MADEELNFTVICFGGENVGISSMVTRTPHDYAHEFEWGIGLEFYLEKVKLGDKRIELTLFEVGKESAFDTISAGIRPGKAGIIMVFDVTRRESLMEVLAVHKHLGKWIGGLPTLLIGNKVDLKDERVVWQNESKKAAESIGAEFMETSVVERLNIEKAFRRMAELILKSKK